MATRWHCDIYLFARTRYNIKQLLEQSHEQDNKAVINSTDSCPMHLDFKYFHQRVKVGTGACRTNYVRRSLEFATSVCFSMCDWMRNLQWRLALPVVQYWLCTTDTISSLHLWRWICQITLSYFLLSCYRLNTSLNMQFSFCYILDFYRISRFQIRVLWSAVINVCFRCCFQLYKICSLYYLRRDFPRVGCVYW